MKSALQAMGVWHIVIGDKVQSAPDSADLEIWICLEAAVSKKPVMCFNAYSDLFSIRKRSDESLNSYLGERAIASVA
jgi:hypothetical protein